MKFLSGVSSAAVVVLLVGCAAPPQTPVAYSSATLGAKETRVGVIMTPLPKADTNFPGAGCLLCIATASIANSALTAHTQSLPQEDLPALKTQVADALRKKGVQVVVIEDPLKLDTLPDAQTKGPNLSSKDFSALKTKHNLDKLVVIEISAIGIERNYSAYIPTSDPKAMLRGTGYVVNLATNTYEWYLPVNVLKSADGKWDEPPKFPGLTNAYFQAVEVVKDSFLKPLQN